MGWSRVPDGERKHHRETKSFWGQKGQLEEKNTVRKGEFEVALGSGLGRGSLRNKQGILLRGLLQRKLALGQVCSAFL